MYLTMDEYSDMGGTIEDEALYDSLEFEAESLINHYTFGRLRNETELPREVKRLMKYLIDLAKSKADALVLGQSVSSTEPVIGTHITNQQNDGVSVSYSHISPDELYSKMYKEVVNAIHHYLDGVKDSLGRNILYRGLYPGE